MATPTIQPFSIRNHDAIGYWSSDYCRFFEAAKLQLAELEVVVAQVKVQWPIPEDQTLRDGQNYPELLALTRKRDLLTDSVKIFSAMAVEGFLNFYGVVRLGESDYVSHFERLGLVPKIRVLLLVCDSLSIAKLHPLVTVLGRIAERRNSLVHPKAKELPGYLAFEERSGTKVPDVAREIVSDMEGFFREFVAAVPEAAHLVPSAKAATA
ncbi:MAG: hypothetical protein Q8L39_11950 [Burkholderiales bacterium]|nr:hypothetical protein [Burkholderiales bacterium]